MVPHLNLDFLIGPFFADRDLEAINKLLPQLNSKARVIDKSELHQVTRNPYHVRVLVARDLDSGGVIVGMACLVLVLTPMRRAGSIHGVVVDQVYRGQGIGAKLIQALIALAREENLERIDLTSNSSRESANRLYDKLGFKRRDTNVFRLEL